MFPCRYGRRNFMNPWRHLPPRVWGVVVGLDLWTRVCGVGSVCLARSRVTCATFPAVGGLLVVLGVCVASVRPISTGRLGIAAVHLRPINPIVCWGPYTLEGWGNLILKRASRLDAFSGYHFRT